MRSFAKYFNILLPIIISLLLIVAVFAAEEQKEDQQQQKEQQNQENKHVTEYEIKIYKRLIPADVLRDFPGMCFASTRCATVEVRQSWDLTPFCGRSTCVQHEEEPGRLLELVEDCGPLPLANDKCKLDTEKTNKTAPFPYCCPIFTCEPGVQLEYPEVVTKPAPTSTN